MKFCPKSMHVKVPMILTLAVCAWPPNDSLAQSTPPIVPFQTGPEPAPTKVPNVFPRTPVPGSIDSLPMPNAPQRSSQDVHALAEANGTPGGTWTTACEIQGIQSTMTQITVAQSSYDWRQTVFQDASCKAPETFEFASGQVVRKNRSQLRYQTEQQAAQNLGGYVLSTKLYSAHMLILEANKIKNANESNLFGYRNWVLGAPKDILDRSESAATSARYPKIQTFLYFKMGNNRAFTSFGTMLSKQDKVTDFRMFGK